MSNNSKGNFQLLTPIIILLSVLIGIIAGRVIEHRTLDMRILQLSNILSSGDSGGESNKLSSTISYIDKHYIDPVSVDSLIEKLMPELFNQLDPHSTYIPAENLSEVTESLEGEFDGIGVVFNMATDTVVVINTIPTGPSDKAGVRAGDRIVMINDSIVAGRKVSQNDIMKQLRGARGTEVKLGIERQGAEQIIDINVTRGVIPIYSIQSAIMLRDNVGYIKMLQFARTTYREIVVAIEKLKKEGMTSLILDLRGNSGGYLDQAISIANEFLPDKSLIVYTEDRAGKKVREYSNGKGRLTQMEVAILIDESSASSSEILAGALQDNDRGVIIGRRSYGKGLVQQQVPFTDGSAMRLTVARYYTPTGRSIQKSYTMGDDEGYHADMINRYRHNELFSADSIHFVDSLKRITPKGRVVYGGGGIMPDIFIPADTTNVTPYFVAISSRNILYNYTTRYADTHREALDNIKSFDELDALFAADKNLLGDFVRYAKNQGVKPVWSEIERSREIIEAQLKAYIGRNSPLDEDAFYHSIYPIDNVVMQAIETLKEGYVPPPLVDKK